MSEQSNKKLVIIGGANGSGKTTFAIPYVQELGFDFLNADEIAKGLEEKGEQNALIKAGRIFFKKLNENISFGKSFVVETTLSGTYINKVAEKAKAAGYSIKVIYIFLDSPELCVERVKLRVLKGGHDVPEEDIIRRFYRSKNNFWNNFTSLADNWILIYNGDEGFQQVAVGDMEEYRIENTFLFQLFLKNVL
ncbi:MAG: zeta toxin family protein [Saprospiraceae bacterium]